MKGNFQVRFLGGCGRVTARTHPAHPEATLRLPSGYPEGYPQATLRLPRGYPEAPEALRKQGPAWPSRAAPAGRRFSSNPAPDRHGGLAGAPPEPRHSTSNPGLEVLRRGSGEALEA